MERAFTLTHEAEAAAGKIAAAIRAGNLPKEKPEQLAPKALEIGIISQDEAQLLRDAEEARNDAVQVDSFTPEEYMAATPATPRRIEFVRA